MLPDELLARVRLESRRRGTSVADVVRDAVEREFAQPQRTRKPLSFFGVGEGAPPDASERVDEFVGSALRKRARRRG
ncbi:MAG: hypothetical protein LBJ87_13225 [bacterium]|nr:hypothetical protein [bacterium]